MSVLSGGTMPALGRAGRVEEAQQLQNAMLRHLVDAAAIQNSPLIMCSNQAPNKTATQVAMQQGHMQQQMAAASTRSIRADQLKHILNQLLPVVCREHVYKVDHAHSLPHDCEIIKWTFFNDLSVMLKVATNWMQDDCEALPIIEDMEEWEANAIMCCEAGDDVWPRPKQHSTSQASASASLAAQANQQSMNSMQSGRNSAAQNQQCSGQSAALTSGLFGSAFGAGGLFK